MSRADADRATDEDLGPEGATEGARLMVHAGKALAVAGAVLGRRNRPASAWPARPC
jgi:hypothetical protein